MPGKEGGDKTAQFWPGIVYAIIFGCIAIFTSLKPNEWVPLAAPLVPVLPTNTAIPTAEAVLWNERVNVVVLDQSDKPFEPYADVVARVSDLGQVDSGEDGQLVIPRCQFGDVVRVWAPGHEITTQPCDGRVDPYRIKLTPLAAIDNPHYIWASAFTDCNNCHGNQLSVSTPTSASFNEMNEWLRSGHAKVFNGGYFESMYRGTTVSGKPSQPAQPIIMGNDWVPVPPEMSQHYHGPGFKLDFPTQPGNCASCHVPTTLLASQEDVDLTWLFPRPQGVWGEGVTCDVCHKVFDVILDDNGFPFANRPGVLSYQFLRPNSGFFMVGPFSNVLAMTNGATSDHRATCSPILSQSEFCAPCHFGKFGDMVVYNSYGEWKRSPYAANPADPLYRTCQDCHMSHMDVNDTRTVWSQRQACSADNTQFQNFDHNVMDFGSPGSGPDIPRMVQDAAEIALDFKFQSTGANSLDVTVQVTNTQAGHKFPTDSPLRHLILVVRAEDRLQTPLMQVAGERIPNWAGPGPATPTQYEGLLEQNGIKDYSGLPGKAFANLLVEEETNLSPGMAYWNETKHAVVNLANGTSSDTRLRPLQPDLSNYSFSIPDEGNVRVIATLIYRYAFYDLMVWKEWFDRPDIVVAIVQCEGPATQPDVLRQSCKKLGPE